MYLEHFGLGVNPFSLSPKLDFLYKSGTFEESMAHLIYGLDHHEAIVLITGAIGTGKTMALQSFLTNLGPRFQFALITNTRVTAIELLKLVLDDLDVRFPMGADKSDLLILFKEYLLNASREGKTVLIIVDEAQNLAPDVLEEIRLLTNLGQGDSQPVQIILVGQPELDLTVNRPDLAQIRQRIRVHYNLDPLSRQETGEYIHHRMGVAGCDREVFTTGAVDTIYQFSRGVPRLVNTLAGEALLSAFVAGHDKVQAGDVEDGKELRFETGPAPVPAPKPLPAAPEAPAPAPPPPSPPAPASAPPPPPPPAPPQPSPPAPPQDPPVMARRNSPGGVGRIVRGWAVAALVVIAVAVLYFTGVFDGLVESIYSRSDGDVASQAVTATESPVRSEPEDRTVIAEKLPENPDPTPVVGEPVVEESPAKIPEPETEVTRPPSRTTETSGDSSSDFYIHISSFRTPDRATSFVRRWPASRVGVISRIGEVRGKEWHRIYIGPFPDRNQALMEALRLREDGVINYYKVTRLATDQDS